MNCLDCFYFVHFIIFQCLKTYSGEYRMLQIKKVMFCWSPILDMSLKILCDSMHKCLNELLQSVATKLSIYTGVHNITWGQKDNWLITLEIQWLLCWHTWAVPGIQSWSFSTVVTMFLCWRRQWITSSVWVVTWGKMYIMYEDETDSIVVTRV